MRVRTGYSFGVAHGDLEKVFSRLMQCRYHAAPITDRDSTFGFVRWARLCKENLIRPIFGVELAVDFGEGRQDYWTFLAMHEVRQINDLVRLSTAKGWKTPALTLSEALEADDVIKIMGNKTPAAMPLPTMDTLFLGISPSSQGAYLKSFLDAGHAPIATSDNYYANEDDFNQYELVTKRPGKQTYPRHILNDFELWQAMQVSDDVKIQALDAQKTLLKSFQPIIPQATLFNPRATVTLRKLCETQMRFHSPFSRDDRYWDRLNRELSLIEKKGFDDYFHVVSDVVSWARARMLVGPARGSSCGSLVCYLLGITSIDPLKYGLLFERFMDENRDDLPDIDIDFSDAHRDEIFGYLENKYGRDHVARLGTVAYWRPKSVLQIAGKAYNIPKWQTDALGTLETLKDAPALKKYPRLYELEGHPRHNSQHAAGVILTNDPVSNYVAVSGDTNTTHCDKVDAEVLGLLKIDALGLTQLSVFEDTLRLIQKTNEFLDQIPLDDTAAFEILNAKKFSGIFQFNGGALQGLTRKVSVVKLEDIIALTALARPGPLDSGAAHLWIARKNGEYYKPYLDHILGDTFGVIVYQEQVMQIAREIGGMSWPEVGALRRDMSKSKGLDNHRAIFLKNNTLPAQQAESLWNNLVTFGAYGFNRSHSVAYGIISYWCCWLKATHPLEFACATLMHEPDADKQFRTLRELAREGIGYTPVDVNLSSETWAINRREGKLVGPLSNIKGMGPKTIATVMGARARKEKLPDRAAKLLANAVTTIDTLFPVAQKIKEYDLTAARIVTKPSLVEDILRQDCAGGHLVIAVVEKINPTDENDPKRVERRKGRTLPEGFNVSLSLWLRDDTGKVFAKVPTELFATIGQEIISRGKADKAIYAFKGKVKPGEFRMLSVEQARYLGDL